MASERADTARADAGFPRYEIRLPVVMAGAPAYVVRITRERGVTQTQFVAEFRCRDRDGGRDAVVCAQAMAKAEGIPYVDVTL